MDQEQSSPPTGAEVDLSELQWRIPSFGMWRKNAPNSQKIFNEVLWGEFNILHNISMRALHWENEARYRNKTYF